MLIWSAWCLCACGKDTPLETSASPKVSSCCSESSPAGSLLTPMLSAGGTQLEVKLVLLWKHNMHIEYLATAPWPLDPSKRSTRVEVTMEGSYDILHDISCTQRKPITSPFRTSVIRRFWNTLQRWALRQGRELVRASAVPDTLLPAWCLASTRPIRCWCICNPSTQFLRTTPSQRAPRTECPCSTSPLDPPLRYCDFLSLLTSPAGQDETSPFSPPQVLSLQHSGSKDSTQVQFASYWKPILSMDATFWQRWLHMHRIVIILEHDL